MNARLPVGWMSRDKRIQFRNGRASFTGEEFDTEYSIRERAWGDLDADGRAELVIYFNMDNWLKSSPDASYDGVNYHHLVMVLDCEGGQYVERAVLVDLPRQTDCSERSYSMRRLRVRDGQLSVEAPGDEGEWERFFYRLQGGDIVAAS